MSAHVSRLAMPAVALAVVLAISAGAPERVYAQASTLDVVGASTVTGLEAGIGTWVLAMTGAAAVPGQYRRAARRVHGALCA